MSPGPYASEDAASQVKEIISRLEAPLPDLKTLLSLLAAPLDCIGLLPPRFRVLSTTEIPEGAIVVSKHIPIFQGILLQQIIPTWDVVLKEEGKDVLVGQYFCPGAASTASLAAGEVALLAYSSILSYPIVGYSVDLIARLTQEYSIDKLHSIIYSNRPSGKSDQRALAWADCIHSIVVIPTKVANAVGQKLHLPEVLEQGFYFNNLSVCCEILIFALSECPSQENVVSVANLLERLVRLGVFPAFPPTNRSQPSFFEATLPIIRRRLNSSERERYSFFTVELFCSLPSSDTLRAILVSLFSSLAHLPPEINSTTTQRALIKKESLFLRQFLGPLDAGSELLDNLSAIILNHEWTANHARVYACWAAGAGTSPDNVTSLEILLDKILDVWANPEHVKYSLLSRHRYITGLLLVTVSYRFPSAESLAFNPNFISGVGLYVSHLDNAIRRLGMLVAEVAADLAGKKLDFGNWDGDDDGKPWTRTIRALIRTKDVDVAIEDEVAEDEEQLTAHESQPSHSQEQSNNLSDGKDAVSAYDSDDSLTGYTSPDSSRSPSPTPSQLEEVERDPTLSVGIKKIPRPVYLAQLGEMLRSKGGVANNNQSQEADNIEIALNCADELVRKKRDYGTELEENAVNLVYALVGLQDNYDLEGFDQKRQRALNTLVACCPRKAPVTIIEEFFKNQYSTAQRYIMLNALALGARELASLPTPGFEAPAIEGAAFPSKRLPGQLHEKYLGAGDRSGTAMKRMVDNLSRAAIERGTSNAESKVPELVRERRLRIQKSSKVSEVRHDSPKLQNTTFSSWAAEFFIAPLINHFWLFLRDEQAREARTAHQEPLHRYRGSGTGLILNAVVLSHFMNTIAILVHAAQNAPEWLAVVAPEALELAITIGTRPISESDSDDEDEEANARPRTKAASILTASLQLALVVLDGCLETDRGRTLGLEHTALILSVGQWAGQVFSQLEKGVLLEGGGGRQEVELRRAVAGVMLKVDELTTLWRRSMIDVN